MMQMSDVPRAEDRFSAESAYLPPAVGKIGAESGLCNLLSGPGRYIRQERAEPLCDRQMRDDGVAELRIGQICQHRCLNGSHDLASLGTDHGEAENAIVIGSDDNLHEALRFLRCLRPQYAAHRQLRHAHDGALALRLAL